MGAIFGGIGSALGGKKASDAAKEQAAAMLQAAQIAAKTARLGFDWLTKPDQGGQYTLPFLTGGANASNAIQALLGLGGDPAAAAAAFRNFQGSTGYNFRLAQGQNAITSSNAAKGLLNSGATLRALDQYGQNLGSQEFGNYLGQLFNVGTQGIDMSKTIGAAGSQAGQAGATAIMNGAQNAAALQMAGIGAQNSGMQGLINGIGGAFNGKGNTGGSGFGNFFGNLF
jgi:hypothetical protein